MSDPWSRLRAFTQARIGLGRSGAAVSTCATLELQKAHAEARDAVWKPWDVNALGADLKKMKEPFIIVRSQATNRDEYLKRPDLGRALAPESHQDLKNQEAELVFIVSDGLSAKSIDNHILPFWKCLAPVLQKENLRFAPLVLAPLSRVAIADEIGSLMKAKVTVNLIGERPGLSANDSLGIYLTYAPKVGNHDANRNCISNVRPPEGLAYRQAVETLVYLVKESLRLKISGVSLKAGAVGLIE